MLSWVIARRMRLAAVGILSWLGVASIALFNPLTPNGIAAAATTWPLWLSVPAAVVAVTVQFGSWAAVVLIPTTCFAMIVYGQPRRETASSRGRIVAARAARSTVGDDTIVDDTIIGHTRINPRRTNTKGMTA